MSTTTNSPVARGGGRPPKFDEPRRPVTLTLPERTLRQLAAIDADRARAIVKVTDAVSGAGRREHKAVDLAPMASGQALIVIGPCGALQRIPWLKLVEIAPARYLLSVPSGMTVEAMELAVRDLLEDKEEPVSDHERPLLEELRETIGHQRRHKKMSKGEILFVDM